MIAWPIRGRVENINLKSGQGDTPDLSEASLATVKMLYPQRLFNLALGKIKKAVDENSKKGINAIFSCRFDLPLRNEFGIT